MKSSRTGCPQTSVFWSSAMVPPPVAREARQRGADGLWAECRAHARRKFVDAAKAGGRGSKWFRRALGPAPAGSGSSPAFPPPPTKTRPISPRVASAKLEAGAAGPRASLRASPRRLTSSPAVSTTCHRVLPWRLALVRRGWQLHKPYKLGSTDIKFKRGGWPIP